VLNNLNLLKETGRGFPFLEQEEDYEKMLTY
jgi:hypothetical protein